MTQPFRHSVSVAAVVTNDQGDVLVIKRRDNGQWQIPGGVLELDESIQSGLIREVHEETGLWVQSGSLTGVYKNIRVGVVALVFSARVVDGHPTPTAETAEVAWWPPERARSEMTQAFAVRVSDALRPASGVAIRLHDGVDLIEEPTFRTAAGEPRTHSDT